MEKTIKIGKQEVRLSNNISWAMVYRDQFGHDIIPTLTPMLAAAMDIISGIFSASETPGTITMSDAVRALDGDTLIDAVAHISGLEFVELINITWSMAKAADDDLPDPKTWARSLDEFPVDRIAPEVLKLAFKGMVSTKNLKRLNDLLKNVRAIQPLTSTPSSSQDSSED